MAEGPLAGFDYLRLPGKGVTLNAAWAGEGPPVLLLHGYPQTHAMWHLVAPRLAKSFSVVALDLRGYGDSDKPPGDAAHERYSKRTMAADAVAAMRSLGFERFAVVGHDRGARVTHRMALDHPEAVERAALLDIIPTRTFFETVDQASARSYYHWFFLAQPPDLPERLIGADPDFYLRWTVFSWTADRAPLAPAAMVEYLRCFRDPATIHATCEDYRAGATIDRALDEADRGRPITCPVLCLWGRRGALEVFYDDVLDVWRPWAPDVAGRGIDASHFLVEDRPQDVADELIGFLRRRDA